MGRSQQRSPVAVVVISSNGKGDRPVGSLEVKVPDGRIRAGGKQTGRPPQAYDNYRVVLKLDEGEFEIVDWYSARVRGLGNCDTGEGRDRRD